MKIFSYLVFFGYFVFLFVDAARGESPLYFYWSVVMIFLYIYWAGYFLVDEPITYNELSLKIKRRLDMGYMCLLFILVTNLLSYIIELPVLWMGINKLIGFLLVWYVFFLAHYYAKNRNKEDLNIKSILAYIANVHSFILLPIAIYRST